MSITATELVAQSSGIYSLPAIYTQLNKKLTDPHASNAQIADIIQLDSGLSSSLLKIVNSAFYGFTSSITTISQAISIIGRTELAEIILGQSAIGVFNKLDINQKTLTEHWQHSLLCGLLAKQLTKTLSDSEQSADSLFVAGLLHDIGRLIIWHQLPEPAKQIIDLSLHSTTPIIELEQSLLGFTHADVGSLLLKSWKLPSLLTHTTEFHHEPLRSQQFQQSCQIVYCANKMSQQNTTAQSELNDPTIQNFSINQEQWQNIDTIAHQQLAEMSHLFLST